MKQNIKIILCVCLLLPAIAYSQPVLPLDSILQKITQNNAMLKVYAYKAEGVKYQAEAATSWMPPMIGAGTFMTPYPFQKLMSGSDKGSLMFQIEQSFPSKSKQQAGKKYLLSKGEEYVVQKEITLNELHSIAKELYFSQVIAEKKINRLKKNATLLETIKKIEEVRYPFNQSQLGMIYKAEAAIENNRNAITGLEGEIQQAGALLNSLMNRPEYELFKTDTNTLLLYRPQPLLLSDTAMFSESRKDAALLNVTINSIQKGITAKSLERKPAFSLRFDHMSPLSGMMPQGFSLMGMMTIPLAPWSSKGFKSEIKAMNFEIASLEQQRTSLLQEAHGRVYAIHYKIINTKKKISGIEDRLIPALQKTLDANFISYQENKLGITELLASWKELNDTELELLNETLGLYQLIISYEKETFQ